jgi:hypothetical protein
MKIVGKQSNVTALTHYYSKVTTAFDHHKDITCVHLK